MSDLKMLKENPEQLFNKLLNMLENGEPLDDSQKAMFEYLKKIYIGE